MFNKRDCLSITLGYMIDFFQSRNLLKPEVIAVKKCENFGFERDFYKIPLYAGKIGPLKDHVFYIASRNGRAHRFYLDLTVSKLSEIMDEQLFLFLGGKYEF